jgi:cell division protease FtsH
MTDTPMPPMPPGPPVLVAEVPPAPDPIPTAATKRVRTTRRKLQFFDRVKILVLLAVVFVFFVVKQHTDIPIMSWGDALDDELRGKWWLLALAGVEIVRQIHFLISEHSARYHRFWTDKVWGRWDRFVQRRDPWLRYRVGRVAKVAFVVAIAALLLGAKWDLAPVQALVEAPSRLFDTLFSNPTSGMPLGLYVMFIVGVTLFQFVALFWFLSKGGVDTYMPEEVETRFDDVWGQDHVLERVRENMVFLENPEELEARGGHVPGGILLWGPPGTGKTLMAEAVAGETGRPYVFVDPGAFTNMFMGVGILKVKSLFRRLRKLALRFGGVIVFFDEADALGNRGGGVAQGHSAAEPVLGAHSCHGGAFLSETGRWEVFRSAFPAETPDPPREGGIRKIVMGGMGGRTGGGGELQMLLTELSGLKKPRGFFNRRVRQFLTMTPKPPPKYRILVMMASNMPDSLDPALLRPGRLDRIYKVGYPAKEGRRRTYEGYFAKVHHEVTPEQIEKLATITPYATGATIKDLVNEAMLVAMRNGRQTITWPDVIEAKKLKQVGPGENVDYIERERHSVAVHEACHAVMAYRVQKGHDIDIATIEKGADFLGFVQPIPLEERFTSWRSTFENDVLVSLASLAGERLFFDGDNSSGVSGDLRSATAVSTAMEAYWGMGATVASHAAASGAAAPAGGMLVREPNLLRGELGERVEDRLRGLLEQAAVILEANRFEVLAVAHALETHKTITGEDIAAIIEGTKGPLVDGRAYHHEAFLAMAEEYHGSALAAHRAQGRVDMPLPVFAPPRELVGVIGADAPSRWRLDNRTGE